MVGAGWPQLDVRRRAGKSGMVGWSWMVGRSLVVAETG